MRPPSVAAFILLALFASVFVAHASDATRFALVRENRPIAVWVEPRAPDSLKRAASDLFTDIARVSSLSTPEISPPETAASATPHATPLPTAPCILVGQLGAGGAIDRLVAEGKLDVSAIRGKWEASARKVVDNPLPGMSQALVIAGSDARGAIYALYEISEEIGVSPWHWWADVPVRKNAAPSVPAAPRINPGPSVQYRGISIENSDHRLRTWAAKTFEPEAGGIGPKTYARVCELLLRLRANTLWPATYEGAPDVHENPEYQRVADRYGIVIGGSPGAPKLFHPRDSAVSTTAAIRLDESSRPPSSPPLAPDDATVLLTDDNFGYVRTFPSAAGRDRPAGFGVHYRLAHDGPPLSYRWLNTTPPALIWSEMSKACELGARKLWIVEVGDIKHAEIGMEFFLRLAFDADQWTAGTLPDFLKTWSAQTFGPQHAGTIAQILTEYYRLNFQRKPEHLQWSPPKEKQGASPFTRDERRARLDAFARLLAQTQNNALLVSDAADAYAQLVLYPVLASAAANERFFSTEEYEQLKDTSPDEAAKWAARAQDAHRTLLAETIRYNEKVAGGKWNRLFALEPIGPHRDSFRIAPPYVPPGDFPHAPPPEPEDLFAKNKLAVPPSSFVERDGIIAIDAHHFSGASATSHGRWDVVRGLGRTGAVVSPFPRTLTPPPARDIVLKAPRLDFVIHAASAGEYTLVLEILPTHPTSPDRPLMFGVALDENLPDVRVIPPHHGTPVWSQAALDGVRKPQAKIAIPAPGRHILRLFGLDPGLALDKLYLVAPQTRLAASYLGPKETPSPPPSRPTPQEIDRRNAQLFQPLQGEAGALSPDGRHLAYSIRSGSEVSVVIRPLPLSNVVAAVLVVDSDETTFASRITGSRRASVRWIRWLTPDRLVFQTASNAIIGVDADGKNHRILQKPVERAVGNTPLNADASWLPDPRKLILRSQRFKNRNDESYAFYELLDIFDGKLTALDEAKAVPVIETDSRQQAVTRASWPEARKELQLNLPGKKIDLLAGDATGRLILFTEQNLADPGSLSLYDRDAATVAELVKRSTNAGFVAPHMSSSIDITDADGRRLTGTLTLPYTARARAAPLIVICPAKPAQRAPLDYHPEFQALADAGFAVAQIEGYSAANNEKIALDEAGTPKQLDHLFRVIDRLAERFPVNTRRMALVGEAHGAQLALRAIQARPDRFRCAIFIDPLTSSDSWARAAATRAKPDRGFTRPALLFSQGSDADHAWSLRGNGLPVTTRALQKRYDNQSMHEVREVFSVIEDFFNEHLYDYDVSIGATKVLED